MPRRPGYLEFRKKRFIKESRGNVCDKCSETFPPEELQIHHRHIPVSLAKKFHQHGEPLPVELVTGDRNAQVLCAKCHENADKVQSAFFAMTFSTIIGFVLPNRGNE